MWVIAPGGLDKREKQTFPVSCPEYLESPLSWWRLRVFCTPALHRIPETSRRQPASPGQGCAGGHHRVCGQEQLVSVFSRGNQGSLGTFCRSEGRRGKEMYSEDWGLGGGPHPGWGGWWVVASLNLAPGDQRQQWGKNGNERFFDEQRAADSTSRAGAAVPSPDPSISHRGLGSCLRKERKMSVIMFRNTILSFILFYSNFPKDRPQYPIELY